MKTRRHISARRTSVEATIRRHGKDFWRRAGAKGGAAKVPKGFAINQALAVEAGRKGGISKRDRAIKKTMAEEAVSN